MVLIVTCVTAWQDLLEIIVKLVRRLMSTTVLELYKGKIDSGTNRKDQPFRLLTEIGLLLKETEN